MKATRETVLKWLESKGHKRSWLAESCEVSKQAVSNWLREKNPQAISANAQLKIRQLMELDEKESKENPSNQLVMNFDSDEFERIELMAHKCGQPLRKWAESVLNSASKMSIKDILTLIGEKPVAKESVRTVPMIAAVESRKVKKKLARI